MIVYVCSKCGRQYSFERYGQIRFCDNCGKRLSKSKLASFLVSGYYGEGAS